MATHSGEAAVDWQINAIFVIIMPLALQCTQCIVRLTANVLQFSESAGVWNSHYDSCGERCSKFMQTLWPANGRFEIITF